MELVQGRSQLTFLMPKDPGLRPYPLQARLTIDAYPSPEALEKGVKECGEAFIEAMAKQGWEYLDKFGVTLNPNPKAHFDAYDAPKRSMQEDWHVNARHVSDPRSVQRLQTVGTPGVLSLPDVRYADRWDFIITAVFLHKTLITEYD